MKKLLIIASFVGIFTIGSVQALTYEEFNDMSKDERHAYFDGLTDEEIADQLAELKAKRDERGYIYDYKDGNLN
jgi:hypothetical protein